MASLGMLKLSLRVAGFAAVALSFAVPAVAGEIYSWRTEDGAYAFTDDAKAVPARYRDRVKIRETEGLADYDRLTAAEPGADNGYARRLADRLAHLRALNQRLDAPRAPRTAAAGRTLELKAGNLNIGVAMDGGGDGPVVID